MQILRDFKRPANVKENEMDAAGDGIEQEFP